MAVDVPHNLAIENLRFKNDSLAEGEINIDYDSLEEHRHKLKSQNMAAATKVVPEIFPQLGQVIEEVKQELVPDYTIDAYVRNSPEAQAVCFPCPGNSISIAMTSGLIKLFPPEELRFVVGHELGHHLMGHYKYPQSEHTASQVEKLNILALQRASEISADRVGFVAAQSKESAYRALLKLSTGLSDEFLRYDFSAYLAQARELEGMGGTEYVLLSSHPTCTMRMRALLWFDMSETHYQWSKRKEKAPISSDTLDKKISRDMSAISGFRLSKINKRETDAAMLWGALSLFVSDGRLSKKEQALVKSTFGEDVASNALEFVRAEGPQAVIRKFEATLRSVRLMEEETKEALYQEIEHFAELAGGEIEIRKNMLQKTLVNLSLDREVRLK